MKEKIYLYDTTLRDGAQAKDVDFTLTDKQDIAIRLDKLGIDYIEGGWPGASPIDDAFFAQLPKLAHAQFSSFGMTRRFGVRAEHDAVLNALMKTNTPCICIVGKTWDFHVEKALEISHQENLDMIAESVSHLRDKEVFFDAEHFFDGYKANKKYALECLKAAYDNGAKWLVLCDTNGGTLPDEIGEITADVASHFPKENIGIHCHNDTENAVAGSLMAVKAGARLVQGTINGIGERCGNANLISIIPNLIFKMGYTTNIKEEDLAGLRALSHVIDEKLNRPPDSHLPYVGDSAFAHKAGLHVSAVAKDSTLYEHLNPALVGNERTILVSDKSGRSNIIARLKQIGCEVDKNNPKITELVELVKERESQGYAYEAADASFELLAKRVLEGGGKEFYELHSYRVLNERRRCGTSGEIVNMAEATVKIKIGEDMIMSVAEGNGPINALDNALRKALLKVYSSIADMRLLDYKVRILTPEKATKALVRVLIESTDDTGERWTTIGISEDVIEASYQAFREAITYKIIKSE